MKRRSVLSYQMAPLPKLSMKSVTVPDRAPTIQEILEMSSRGVSAAVRKNGVYYGDQDVPNVPFMDLADYDQMRRDNLEQQRKLTVLQDEYKKEKLSSKRKSERQAFDEKVEAAIAQRTQNIPPNAGIPVNPKS